MSRDMSSIALPIKKFFGFRQGRSPSWHQQSLLDGMVLAFRWVSLAQGMNAGWGPIWMGIGFDKWGHLLEKIKEWPQLIFIGIEAFQKGVSSFLSCLLVQDCGRSVLFSNNGHLLMPQIPASFLDGIFLFFPDPWPKKNQKKKRLVDANFLKRCAHILKTAGQIWIDRDAAAFLEKNEFEPINQKIDESPWTWTSTTYAKKAPAKGNPFGRMIWRKQ